MSVSYTHLGCEAPGTTEIVLTVLDALSYIDKIPVCVAYEVDGKIINDFPSTPTLKKCKPVLEVLDGWKCDIKGIREFDKLPQNAQNYVKFIEKQIGMPITMVSNGPNRSDIIFR